MSDKLFSMPRQIRHEGAARFDFLSGAIGRGVNPSDIDLVYERRGHFLFIECKRPEQAIPRGQAILFDSLIALSREDATVKVLIVIGHPPQDIRAARWWGTDLEFTADAFAIRQLALEWFQAASRAAPNPKRKECG
jgi:hypothetical protein